MSHRDCGPTGRFTWIPFSTCGARCRMLALAALSAACYAASGAAPESLPRVNRLDAAPVAAASTEARDPRVTALATRLHDAVQVIHASRAAGADDSQTALSRLSRISHGLARIYVRPDNPTPCRICGGMLEPCATVADPGLTMAETTVRAFL
ncbi:MAG TPA: hypothetical protein VGM03_01440, partial [Phycisphaerae bacterium]